MSGYSRTEAFMSMTSPLGQDVLIPVGLSAEEAIGGLFSFSVEVVSEQARIDPNRLLNQAVCVILRRPNQPTRYFNGIVRRFAAVGTSFRGLYGYRLVIGPLLWLLSQIEDCQVFQNKSALDIVEEVLASAGITTYELRVYGDRPTREYTIQYDETNLTFISRLLQEDGYFYFFEHTADAHTLVIADANAAFHPIKRPQIYVGSAQDTATDALTAWQTGTNLTHGKIELQDYDPAAPSKSLDATQNTTLKAAGAATRSVYHWPAHTFQPPEVNRRTRLRIEADEAAACLLDGAGNHEGFYPGGRFTLVKDPYAGNDGQEYVLHSVVHTARDESWIAGGAVASYANSFTAFDNTRPWRERLTIERPRMDGVYSGLVMGVAAEEIYTDSLGRVKVWLRFDHHHDATPEGSIWVRVSQPWAGNGWGWQYLPRVGTEVVVAFMDGDPDRPIVIGGVYNGEQMPPFPLPGEKTKSGLRTRSTLNGTTSEYSEFSIDDKQGQELVFLRAQKDHQVEVEDSQTVTIGNGRTVTIKSGGDSLTVEEGNLSITVSAGAINVSATESITLTVEESSIIISPEGIVINSADVEINGDITVNIDGATIDMESEGEISLIASDLNIAAPLVTVDGVPVA
jgi:type VI secretion system secreted protein VgrG